MKLEQVQEKWLLRSLVRRMRARCVYLCSLALPSRAGFVNSALESQATSIVASPR
jgi:hypothetical protein